MTAEQERLQDPAWKRWGPYLSERAWGTVREDYSADADPWSYFPFDHARSRAYRWNEDGLGGICDDQQVLCFAMAFWNGKDPILKERIFGLSGPEGNHGEDAKENWWYEDATPTHSWMQWRYVYPQSEFPYEQLRAENAERGAREPEFELVDTGVLDPGFWDISVTYAKADADDVCVEIRIRNAGPDAAELHVLPQLWFRNTWSWGRDNTRGTIRLEDDVVVARHPAIGIWRLAADDTATALFCDNETNTERLFGEPGPEHPKDGIGDHVVTGAPTVDPALQGTKAAWWHRVTVPAGATETIRLRLGRDTGSLEFDAIVDLRRAEADRFYTDLLGGLDAERRSLARQALAGLLWSKQWYHFDVDEWLAGDPAFPPPPPDRRAGRNAHWTHLNNADVIAMPDKWEYPWYAVWDSAFHCIGLAHVDPGFAKDQLLLFCREWYMHPNGQLPAYEWNFGDVNPPVHARAALEVFEIDGGTDFEFLERICHKLMLNFTWWVNRKDTEGNNVFEGGFLGLDNIGPFDRSAGLEAGAVLEQADGTAWMAMFCLDMFRITVILAEHDPSYEDLATKFFEHFTYIGTAIHTQGLWSEDDGFYHDLLHTADRRTIPLQIRSMVGLIPLFAAARVDHTTFERLRDFANRYNWFNTHKPQFVNVIDSGVDGGELFSVVGVDRLERILGPLLDPDEFLSQHGVRSMSRRHLDDPFVLRLDGARFEVGYEPGESRSGLFGGNSNWRGPVWLPVNHLLISALREFGVALGDGYTVEFPTGSGNQARLTDIANDLSERLSGLLLDDRPAMAAEPFTGDPQLGHLLTFHEYFNGDTGLGHGASHQTGWTALIADLLIRS